MRLSPLESWLIIGLVALVLVMLAITIYAVIEAAIYVWRSR